ncbi:MAG TPA: DUF5320 domain-containing protein [Caldisericia bacterium]|jgi:hypothetical protein|nr:DUF5320 domain-containing protein [Caldisericia bacterium]HXK51108.1 DUF5320 domain-containing protein [Caldisericia bacterium]
MPRFDRTGPNGQGPMTGRGLGKCNPESVHTQDQPVENAVTRSYPRFLGWARGQGFGRGMRLGGVFGRGFRSGRGRGFGNFYRNGW